VGVSVDTGVGVGVNVGFSVDVGTAVIEEVGVTVGGEGKVPHPDKTIRRTIAELISVSDPDLIISSC
jgi:hypothetical protein